MLIKSCHRCNKSFKIKSNCNFDYCYECRCIKTCSVCGSESILASPSNVDNTKPCSKCSLISLNSNRNGESNPFYGKKHKKESLAKIGKYQRTEKQKEQARNLLKLVSNKKHPYDIWKEKYGVEKADELLKTWKAKVGRKGKQNGMYGKPSPIGSGNGWSGWYKGIYFRSILELSYLKYLIDNDIKFESGELKKYAIEYQFKDEIKTYFCDFVLIESMEFIELKPTKLQNIEINLVKFSAAKKLYGDKFKIIDYDIIKKLSNDEIYIIYNNGDLKWTKKYETKYNSSYFNKGDSWIGKVHDCKESYE